MKSQSSIEFMMNYGWMILIALIAGFLLFQLGVFNAGYFTGFQVKGLSNFHIQDAVIDESGNLSILLAFKSNDYFTITNIAYDVLGEDCAGDDAFNQRLGSELIELNAQALSECNIGSNNAKMNITIKYLSKYGLERIERGEISLSVNKNQTQSQIVVPEIELQLSNVLNSSITNQSAIISWDTNKLANSSVIFGQTLSMSDGSNQSAAMAESHSLLISNLLHNSTYYYNATSCNDSCKTLGPYSFQTQENIPAPIIFQKFTINFDNAGQWVAGSGLLTSYQTNHVYSQGGWVFTGGPALRDTTVIQDGFPSAIGTYSWRLRDQAATWTATYSSANHSAGFGFYVRRWDNDPNPSWSVSFSTNAGSTFNSTGITINNAFLEGSSNWKLLEYNFSSPLDLPQGLIVRLQRASGERIMIDDFFYYFKI